MLENFDKEYLKQVALRVGAFVGGILLIAYIGYQIWHKVTSFVETETAVPFTVSEKNSGEGYIFREETVIDLADSGSLVTSVEEGEKVAIGANVANIYSSAGVGVEARMAEIDRQISLLTASLGNGELTNRDVSKLDGEIYGVLTDMKQSISKGDYSDAVAMRTSLLTKINKRKVASGADGDISAKINSLRQEKETLVSQLGQLQGSVSAPCAGWYYPESDGYESVFLTADLDKLTYDSFRETVSKPATVSTTAGKIVTDCKWYFVCEVSSDEMDNKSVGNDYTIYFTNNQSMKISMILEQVCESEDGKRAVAVYSSDKLPKGFDFVRKQKYEILENEYTGLKVPKSAVRIIDGQMGVYVLTGEVVHFRKIQVITEYDGGYLVEADPSGSAEEEEATETSAETEAESTDEEGKIYYRWLRLNENIIISGKGLREGRIITNLS